MAGDRSIQGDNAMERGEIGNPGAEIETRRSSKAKAGVQDAEKIEAGIPDGTAQGGQIDQAADSSDTAGPGGLEAMVNKADETPDDSTSGRNAMPNNELNSRNDAPHGAPRGDVARRRGTVVHFHILAIVNINHLGSQLIAMQKAFDETSNKASALDSRRLEDTLHRYTTAIRDYEYMAKLDDDRYPPEEEKKYIEYDFRFSQKAPKISFKTILSRNVHLKKFPDKHLPTIDPMRRWVKNTLPRKWAWTVEEADSRWSEYLFESRVTPDILSPLVDRLARFVVALVGGLSLVVPMIIMSLDQNSSKSLITASVAVVLFAGVVSIVFNASNAETLGITAAYAAVLVVFVGTSTSA